MSTPFIGADFRLESLAQLGPAVVRIRFTQDPLSASSSGAHDALNPAQYTLSGPGANLVTVASVVGGDPQSIDITLSAPLLAGSWQVAVSPNVQTASGRPLQAPTALTLEVSTTAAPEPVSQGAVNDTAESILRKFLNPALKGKAWDALIAAFAVGDQYNWDNAKAAFDQLFKSTASGMYLDRKNGDDGFKRPANIGIGDELYRQLGIKVTNAKLTEQVILEILEVFYGSDSLRGHIDTGAFEPYILSDGDTLVLNVDGVDLPVLTFRISEFARIGQATALEVATSITRQLGMVGSTAFASVVKDPVTGASGVRIYSGALGLISSVQVNGGLAQEALRFEQQIQTPPAGTDPATITWNLTIPEAGSLVLKVSGTVALDMNQLQVGDYVLVTGDSFDPANRGSFPITAVDIEYVGATYTQKLTIANDAAVAQTSVTQASLNDVLFFRPVVKAIHNGGTRTVVVAQPDDGAVDVVIPATTQAVNRTPGSGAYILDSDPLPVTSIKRDGTTVTVTTSTPHGLQVGQQVIVDDAFATSKPPVTAGDGSSTSDASLGTTWSAIGAPTGSRASATLTKLQNGTVLLVGGEDGGPAQTTSCKKFVVTGTGIDVATGGVQYSYAWQGTGSLSTARARHTASLLNDGSVFVAGGETGGTTATATTEVWTADVWSAGPALSTARRNHQAQVLNDGTVLIFGGDTGPGSNPLASCEVYNGSTITAGSSMVAARTNFASVKLSSGKVLAIGGNDLTGGAGGISRTQITVGVDQSAEQPAPVARYVTDYTNQVAQDYLFLSGTTSVLVHHDGTTETITPPALGSGGDWNLYASVGCRVNDTKCMVITIYSDLAGAWTFRTWYFDWTTKTFTAATNPPATLSDLGSDLPIPCLMANGKVLWIWGPYNGTTHVTPCYIFDPAGTGGAGTWTATGDYPGPFAAPHTLLLLNDGRVLSNGNGTDSFTFDSGTGTWTAHSFGASSVQLNYYSDLQYAMIKLHDGRVFLALSGENAAIFDPTTNIWTDQPSGTHTTYNGVWAVEYAPNKVFVAEAAGGLYYYDIDTTTWTEDGSPTFVHPDVAGWLDTGKWAVINVRDVSPEIDVYSYSAGGATVPALLTCEVYTPGSGWALTGNLSIARANARAIVLDDGRVLVTGGTNNGGTALATAEVYDPASGRWSPAGKMRVARSAHSMSFLKAGGLIAITGSDTSPDYYNPKTGTWRSTPSSLTAGAPLSAQVQDGVVLAVGTTTAALLNQDNDSLMAGGLNGVFRVESVTTNSFTYKTPNVSAYSSSTATVRAMAASAAPDGFKGPYVLDTQSDVAITGVETTTTQDLFQGRQYTSLKVVDATKFPDDEGYLVIGYGTDTVSYPIHYLGRISDTELLLDYQQKMPKTNLSGANVTLLSGKAGLTSVDDPGDVGLFYATDSSAGRAAAQDQLESVIATGINLNLEVVFPGSKGLGKDTSDWVWSGEES